MPHAIPAPTWSSCSVSRSGLQYKDYVVNFSCMSDSELHYVHKHTDDDDIQFQYAVVLGNCTGGELKLWRHSSHGSSSGG
jgi:hypothetical protein